MFMSVDIKVDILERREEEKKNLNYAGAAN
jgi:hypothetical protein